MNDDELRSTLSDDFSDEPRQTGYVKWFDEQRQYGFIRRENGSDLFVHASSVNRDPPTLREYERVEFNVMPGDKGPEARNVTVLAEAA